ncbi:hypothetical protein Rhopal_007379-T1 [Rhodotorula paludigena]|uniref:Seipin n=1 Tax=Rhodotorula paludigena TaxID=86838 RepID=A0AAV5GXW0_9BASI|nr:hypothetical protein Rhopal_007379-T1 [Rhodotorula paludigena]
MSSLAKGPRRPSRREESSSSALYALASLAVRSLALGALVSLAVVVALAAWLSLRSALRVDPLVGRERVWLQHHRPPYAHVELDHARYTVPGKVYDVALEVTAPVNHNNLDLGNFMVSVSLLDGSGDRVLNASRPAILAHPSSCTSLSRRRSFFRSLLLRPLSLLRTSTTLAPSSYYSTPYSARSTVDPTSLTEPCVQTLRIPLLESASFTNPSSSLPLGGPSRAKVSRWRRGSRKATSGPVKGVYVQIGREDSHPLPARSLMPEELAAGRLTPESHVIEGNRRFGERERARELQVYEAWVRVEVKVSGLRGFLHSHPYLAFTLFFPSFLTLELIAALAMYIYYVASSSPTPAAAPSPRRIKREDEEREDVKPLLSPATLSRSASTAGSEFETEMEETEGERALREAEDEARGTRRAMRLRLGRGGVGMSALEGDGEEETEEEEEDEGESASVSEAAEAEERARVKLEEEEEERDDFSDEGPQLQVDRMLTPPDPQSTTTRRTRSTFGPSLAGTTITHSTTTTTATGRSEGASAAGLRGRGSAAATAAAGEARVEE